MEEVVVVVGCKDIEEPLSTHNSSTRMLIRSSTSSNL